MKILLLHAIARPYYYGGQAVMEGVMMRGALSMAVAVRTGDGGIRLHQERLRGLYVGRIRRVPLLRGVIVLAETLTLGMKALLFSANAALEDEGEEEISGRAIAITLTASLTFIATVFFIAPLLATGLIGRLFATSGVALFALEGGIRLAMFLGYVALIGRLKDIRRTFAYHAAEHRTIHAWEHGAPLTAAGILPFPNAHPRCGTGFLLVVMVVAIVVFAAVGDLPWPLLIFSRVALLPVIAAIAYEILRFSAAFWRFRLVRLVFRPNLTLQSLTTRNPDSAQIEVAIAALNAVIAGDAEAQDVAPSR